MASTKQQAVQVTSAEAKDDFTHVELKETDRPTLEHGQVLVKVFLRPVNPTDILQAAGARGKTLPANIGSEGLGIVEELGPGTTNRLKVQQRVVSANWGQASWQQYVAVNEEFLVGVPDDINDEIAAQSLIGTLTAMGLVQEAAVPKGSYLLQTAAASAVARQVIQYAASIGVKTINVVRRSEQKQELKQIGADEVIDSSTEDVVARVKKITGGKGAYSALDAVAGSSTGTMMASIRKGGTTLVYGLLSGQPVTVPFSDLLSRTVGSFIIYSWLPAHGLEGARQKFEDAFEFFRSGTLTTHPGKRFPLSEVRAAIMESLKPGRSAAQPKVFLEG